jgi:hypothetical protein
MHVDGSVAAFVFYSGGVWSFDAARRAAGKASAGADIYVIHNGQLLPNPRPTPRSMRSIAVRVFESSGKASVLGDLFRIYTIATREQSGYHWITIPDGVEIGGNEVFDPQKMRELYDLGYRTALAASPWFREPPGVAATNASEESR